MNRKFCTVSLAIDVGGHHTQPLAQRALDIGAARDIGKSTVAVVVIEEAAGGLEHARNAIILAAQLVVAAREVMLGPVIDEAAHEQIQAPVVIVVEPDRAGGPSGGRQAGLFGDVGELSVAVIVIQDRAAVRGDKQVGKTVVVIVAHGYAHAESAAGYAGFFGHIGEGSVTVVLVKRVADGLLGLVEIGRAAIHQIDIHPSVVVVIQECNARAHGLGQIMIRGRGVVVDPPDAALLRRNLIEDRRDGHARRERPQRPQRQAGSADSRGGGKKTSS
jgi:hypothetical protein